MGIRTFVVLGLLSLSGVGHASPETLKQQMSVSRGEFVALQLAVNLRFTLEVTRLAGGSADMRAYRIGNGEVAPFTVAFDRNKGRIGILLAGKTRTPRDAAAILASFKKDVLTHALELTAAQSGVALTQADVHLRYIGPDGAKLTR